MTNSTARQVMESPVGPLMVEAEGDNITKLDWAKSLPLGFQERPNQATEQAIDILKHYFGKDGQIFDFKYNPRGTDFQKKVWQALTEIPYGQTVTYNDIAKKLNSSPRAVGGAVGANPVPILIPCHRVVGANGHMTGYSGRGGIATKEFLLKLEQGS